VCGCALPVDGWLWGGGCGVVAVGGCGWMLVAGVGACGWLLVAMACGRLCVAVRGCGWLWVAVGGCGWLAIGCWLWLVVGCCGWLCRAVGGYVWLRRAVCVFWYVVLWPRLVRCTSAHATGDGTQFRRTVTRDRYFFAFSS
jgi:hypothetical protein